MKLLVVIGWVLSLMILYFHSMNLIHKMIHGKSSKMSVETVSNVIFGSILIGVSTILFGALMS